ncbi:WYL domain-containing protein [Oscillatoria acuminata]|uniref:WYL domain-containing protein n=1 Tax=Oscillatoria acuminata TaxID=118323 RepID=UPI001E36B388|nr:WYL domain-containing protein [Oscillatoria acuminata]
MGEFLYENNSSIEDVKQKFDRTLRELRDWGFKIDHRPYSLVESNFPIILSASQRHTLYRAAHFLTEMNFATEAQQLVRLSQLGESDSPPDIQVDFAPPTNYSAPQCRRLLEQLQDRCAQKYRFTLRYIDSQKQELTMDLDRCELRLHDGTLYLFAFVPDLEQYHRNLRPELVYRNWLFRVDRIKSVGPPSTQAWVYSSFPTLTIRYRMTGPLANYVPRRIHEQVIERNLKQKYVEIETQEDYPFWFRQRILRYGSNARVIDPPWIVEEIATILRKAASNYDDIPGP